MVGNSPDRSQRMRELRRGQPERGDEGEVEQQFERGGDPMFGMRIAAAHLANVMGEDLTAGGCRGHALQHSDDWPCYDRPRFMVR